MSACEHCNFRDTDKCIVVEIQNKLDEGLISEEEADSQSQHAYMKCEDNYYDYQLGEY